MLLHVTEGQVTPKDVRSEVMEAIVCACPTGTMATCHRRSPEGGGRVRACATGSWVSRPFFRVFSDMLYSTPRTRSHSVVFVRVHLIPLDTQ